jgi:hypothetical protein
VRYTSGDIISVGVAPGIEHDMSNYVFSVKSCTIAAGETEFILFNESVCSRPYVGLDVSYDGQFFQMTHKAFVLEKNPELEQTLSCAIELCDTRAEDTSACDNACGRSEN